MDDLEAAFGEKKKKKKKKVALNLEDEEAPAADEEGAAEARCCLLPCLPTTLPPTACDRCHRPPRLLACELPARSRASC